MKKSILIAACFVSLTFAQAQNTSGNTAAATATGQTTTANNGDYYGTYKLENLPIDQIVVSDKDGKLYYVAGEYQDVLTPMTAKDQFDANGQSTFTFMRGSDTKVKSVVVNIQGQEITAQKEMTKMDVNAFVGKYKMEGMPFEYTEITTKNGKLYFNSGEGQYTGELMPKANKDEFDAGEATAKFKRNADDVVTTVYVTAQGQDFKGMREMPKMGMAEYSGKYKMTGLPFENMEIMTKDGKLMIDAMGQVGELKPLAEKDAFDASGQAIIKFTRDASGKVNGVTLQAQGQDFGGEKISALFNFNDDFLQKEIRVTMIAGSAFLETNDNDWLRLPTPDNEDEINRPARRVAAKKFDVEDVLIEEIRTDMIAGNLFMETAANDWARIPTPADAVREAMIAYVGAYQMNGLPFAQLEVVLIDGSLIVLVDERRGALTPEAGTDTFDAAGRAILQFVRNADREVTGITLAARGLEFSGQKSS